MHPDSAFDLTVTTWNIHRGRGADGRIDPDRIARALAAEVCPPGAAHVLALQEADAEAPPHRAVLPARTVTAATGLVTAHAGPRRRWGAASLGFHGNALFVTPGWRIRDVTLLDLPGVCPRGAILAEMAPPGGPALRLLTAHLSLWQPLRIAQMRVIGQHLARRAALPTILAGDLNEWRPWGGAMLARRVTGRRLSGPAPATFPVRRPLLPMDRVLSDTPRGVAAARALTGPLIRAASDHLPLRARVHVVPAP